MKYPRFFFVSDPVLLEILGEASDSHKIQPHLLSIYENVHIVTFDESEYNQIISISSREGETVPVSRIKIISTDYSKLNQLNLLYNLS